MSEIKPHVSGVGHQHLCQFFNTMCQTEEPATPLLSTRQLLVHLHSSSFWAHFSVSHHSAYRQHIHRRQGCVHQKRLQTETKVGCVPSSYILNIGIQACSMSACTCSALAVCVPSSRCTITIFSLSTPIARIASGSAVCAKPVFPSRHPVLPVVLMRLSRFIPEIGCQAAHLLPGWGK